MDASQVLAAAKALATLSPLPLPCHVPGLVFHHLDRGDSHLPPPPDLILTLQHINI
jgi:hypothetical protein